MPIAQPAADQLATVLLAGFGERARGAGPGPTDRPGATGRPGAADRPAATARPGAQSADWGIPVLARMLAGGTGDQVTARAAVLEWVSGHPRGTGYQGLFGSGLAGRAVGFAHAAAIEPRLAPVARASAVCLAESSALVQRRDRAPASRDYDLIGGAAGITLAMASLPSSPPGVTPLARYLSRLGDDAQLPRLCIGSDGGMPSTRWTLGCINFGLGHGIPGILAALIAAWPRLVGADQELAAGAIRRIAAYLVRHARRDDRGVIGWPFACPPDQLEPCTSMQPTASRPDSTGRSRAARAAAAAQFRQAWCYGTPGVAWQLAEAGRVLGDAELSEFGRAAMASLADAWDDDLYLDEQPGSRIAFCHGAAGVLALADAFALHADLAPARRLAGHLAAVLAEDLTAVARLAAADLTVLNGAAGILAVLLSRDRGRRDWLRPLGLR